MPDRRKHNFVVSGSKKLELTLPSNFFTLNADITNSLSNLKEAVDNIDKFSDKPRANKLFQQVPMQKTNIHALAKQLPTESQALCYAIFVIYLKHSSTPLSDINRISLNDFKEKYQSKFKSISNSKIKTTYKINEEKWRTLHTYRDIIVLTSSILPFHGNKALMLNIACLLVDKQLASLGSGATIFNQLRVAIYEEESQIITPKRKHYASESADSVCTYSFWNKKPFKKSRVSIKNQGSSPVETHKEKLVSSNLSAPSIVPSVLSSMKSDKQASLTNVVDNEPTNLSDQDDIFDDESISLSGQGDVFDDESISLSGQGDVFDDESISLSDQGDVFDDESISLSDQGDVFDDESISLSDLDDAESICSDYPRFYKNLNRLNNTSGNDDSVHLDISLSFNNE